MNNRMQNVNGYALILVLVITLIMSSYIVETKISIWQQYKLLKQEKIRVKINKTKQLILNNIINKLLSYKNLENTPSNITITINNNLKIMISEVSRELDITDINLVPNNKCSKYIVYKADLCSYVTSLLDVGNISRYHLPSLIYFVLCEDLNTNNLKIYPLTNLIV